MRLINLSYFLEGFPVKHLHRSHDYNSDIYQNTVTGALSRLPLMDGEECPDNLIVFFCSELGIPTPSTIKGLVVIKQNRDTIN